MIGVGEPVQDGHAAEDDDDHIFHTVEVKHGGKILGKLTKCIVGLLAWRCDASI